MKTGAYHRLAINEVEHWYYRARAQAIETLIRRFVLPSHDHPEILDVGCGTGGTSARLAQFGNLTGIEPSPVAIELLRARYPSLDILPGTIEDLPSLVPADRFDLVTVLGVLYHRRVNDPNVALKNIAATLHDDGWILWSDCVYPCLARSHDDIVESGRRFHPQQMHRMLRAAGFNIVFSSHFLGWGFPFAWGMAAVHRFAKAIGLSRSADQRESVDDRSPPALLNDVLRRLTFWEWRAGLWGLKVPLGVSRLILARKIPDIPESVRIKDRSMRTQMAGMR